MARSWRGELGSGRVATAGRNRQIARQSVVIVVRHDESLARLTESCVFAIRDFVCFATAENRAPASVVRHVQLQDGTMFSTLETYLPADLQVKATMHFTPPAVARRVARLLCPQPGARVLDVGAGPGLFCVAGALAVPSADFFGVEWRARLVDVAVGLAERLELANAYFIHADVLAIDWSAYDAFYLFNPFAEHVLESPFVIDRSVALDPKSYVRYIVGVQDRLAVLPLGTRVATFHGFGGELPPGYVLVTEEAHGTDKVELWIRAR